ncbi:MAG: toll/interleukin-1 receptor domain-containing protein [Gemmatimonadaceae bacterium]
MPRRQIFVSYRRDDSAYVTATIREKLEEHFARDSIFMDIDSVPLGMDFRKHLDDAVSRCDVLIAVIGDNWAATNPQTSARRIDDPSDFVRIEVEAALKRNIPVIPVLVGNATMPREQDLPEPLRELTFRNATEIRAGRDLGDHLNRLVKGLNKLFEANPETRSTAETETDLNRNTQPKEPLATRTETQSTTANTSAPNTKLAIVFFMVAVFFNFAYLRLEIAITYSGLFLHFVPAVLSVASAIKSRGSLLAPFTSLVPILLALGMTGGFGREVGYVLSNLSTAIVYSLPAAAICYMIHRGKHL